MSFTVIIPARLKSSRLPDKPLADICGRPMIVRVAERALSCGADRVVVAVDDASVYEACAAAGLDVIMTDPHHPTGTDRLAEAVAKIGLADDEIVVNLQGDEPLMPLNVIRDVADLLASRPDWTMQELKKIDEVAYVRFASVYQQFADVESFFNPNVVKVVLDDRGTALTFSRAPIPWPRDHFRETKESLPEGFAPLHHLGLYAYRAGFLRRFPTLPQAPLEKLESLEQLRALYYGERIAVMVLDAALPAGVDTQKDLDRVRAIFEKSAPV